MRTFRIKRYQRIHCMYFTPDGGRLLVIAGPSVYTMSAAIWVDLATGAEAGRVEFPDPNCYTTDSAVTRLMLGGDDGYAEGSSPLRWIALDGKSDWQEIDMGGVGRVRDVAFDPSGTLLAVSSSTWAPRRTRETCKVDVFRFALGEVPKRLYSLRTERAAGALAFNADASRLAVGAGLGGDDAFEVFDLKTRRRRFQFDPEARERRCVRFLPDNRLAVAAGATVCVLPAHRGKPQFVLGDGKAVVNDIVVSADGRRVCAAMNNGTVRFWDVNTGEPGPTFAWGVGGVWSVALAPDGLTCAAAGSKGRIVIWDVEL